MAGATALGAQRAASLVARSRAIRQPRDRYVDLCIRFRVRDGARAGESTRCFGGRWDTVANAGLGAWAGYWMPGRGWVRWSPELRCVVPGEEPRAIHEVWVSAQQLPFILDFKHKVALALGGRRSGKTRALALKCIVMMLVFAGVPGAVLSPTYRQARNVWRAVLRSIPRNWLRPGKRGVRKSEYRLCMITGAELLLLSADNEDSARSEGVAWGAYDERQDISEEAAANALLSTSEGEGAYHVFETATIKAELREHYDRVMASQYGEVYTMRSRGNPFIAHDIFDQAEEFMDTARIKQELEAEWPILEGRIYYPFDREKHIRPWPARDLVDITQQFCHEKFDLPAKYIIGIDPPHAATVCLYCEGDILYALDEVVFDSYEHRGDVRDLVRELKDRGYFPAVVVIDPNETNYDADLRKYLRKAGYRITPVRRVEVEYRFTAHRARIEKNKHFVNKRCERLIAGYDNQVYLRNKPDKLHGFDHSPDSVGYIIYRLWPAKYAYEKNERKLEKNDLDSTTGSAGFMEHASPAVAENKQDADYAQRYGDRKARYRNCAAT